MIDELDQRLEQGLVGVRSLGSVAEEAFFERLQAELVTPDLSLAPPVIVTLYHFLCRHDRADGACHLAAARLFSEFGHIEAACAITEAVLEAEPDSVAARALWQKLGRGTAPVSERNPPRLARQRRARA